MAGATGHVATLRASLATASDADVAELTCELADLVAVLEGVVLQGAAELAGRGLADASGQPTVREFLLTRCALVTPARAGAIAALVRETRRVTGGRVGTTTVGPDGGVRGPGSQGPIGAFLDDAYDGRISPGEATETARTHDYVRRLLGEEAARDTVPGLRDLARTHPTRRDLLDYRSRIRAAAGDPDQDREQDAAHHARGMSAFRRVGDGLFEATVRLDATAHAIVASAIDALAAPSPLKDGTGTVIAPDERTPAQRRADALVQLAKLAQSDDVRGPMGASTRLVVTIGLDDLLAGMRPEGASHDSGQRDSRAREAPGPSEESGDRASTSPATTGLGMTGLAMTSLGTSLSVSQIRHLACESDLIPAVLDTAGAPLDVGRAVRHATKSQRDYLMLRDGGCTWPGCDAPPTWCRAHHLDYWHRDQGRTDVKRMVLICDRHHREAHRLDATVTFTGGRPSWDVALEGSRWVVDRPQPQGGEAA